MSSRIHLNHLQTSEGMEGSRKTKARYKMSSSLRRISVVRIT